MNERELLKKLVGLFDPNLMFVGNDFIELMDEAQILINNPKPPTVEISLEDAKIINKQLPAGSIVALDLLKAISKAESYWWGTSDIDQLRNAEPKKTCQRSS